MKYANAQLGISKIYKAGIFNIIASVIALSASIFLLNENRYQARTILIAQGIIVAASVVSIIAFILQMIGIKQAKKDEPLFRPAFIFAVAGIAATIVYAITSGTFSNLFAGINEVTNLLVTVYIILSVYSIALSLNAPKVLKAGKITTVVVCIVFAFAVGARVITIFYPVTDLFLDIFCSALDLISYLMFLTYIGSAKKMLTK